MPNAASNWCLMSVYITVICKKAFGQLKNFTTLKL